MYLTDYTYAEVEFIFKSLNEKPFRAKQLVDWIYNKNIFDFNEMSNFSLTLRNQLCDQFRILSLSPHTTIKSKDGTTKYAFKCDDNYIIESVLIPMDSNKTTFCISSQVGCAMGCKFCNTASMGFTRNLEVSEIISQVLYLKKEASLTGTDKFNIVFMGMGEPLLNYDNVMKALNILWDEHGLNLSRRRITVSTCGIIEQLVRLSKEKKIPRIAVSLNASIDEIRSSVMPINKKYPLEKLVKCLKEFPLDSRERFTFEYVLIGGVNDSEEDARRIARTLNGLRYKINLIPFNEFPECNLKKPGTKSLEQFQQILVSKNITAIVRKSKGDDIKAACGQLASKKNTLKTD